MAQSQQMHPAPRSVLLIKHSKGWDVDRVNRWAEKRGHNITRCYPADGEALPDVTRFDGVVIFGGAMSANDCKERPWMRSELNFIENCLQAHVKFFGICLGAQLLARILGAKVCQPQCCTKEIGFYPLKPESDSNFIAPGDTMFQWHSEGFELPPGATHLASSEAFPNQAFCIDGGHYGVQFHPEVNPDSLKCWHARIPADKYPWLTEELRQHHMNLCENSDQRITKWIDSFLDQWISY